MEAELDRLSTDVLTQLAQNESAPRTTRESAIDILLDRHLGREGEAPELAARRREALEELKLELQTGRKVMHYSDPHAAPPPQPVMPREQWEEVAPSPAVQLLKTEEVLRAKQVLPELLRRYNATGIAHLSERQVWHWASTQGFGREHEVTKALLLAREGASLGERVKKESA